MTELSSVIDALPGLVWTALPNGEVDFLNQRWCEYTGIPSENSHGRGWQKAIHPDDLPRLLGRWESAILSGQSHEVEARIRRFNGEYRWFLFRTSPIKDASGAVVKWCGINWEIEDRKQGERLLRESEQRFKTIFDEAGTGITLVDLTSGQPIRNNRALQTMLGCSEEELSRFDTFDQLTYEPNREADAVVFRELCEGKYDTLRMEKHFIRRDGSSVWANVIFTLLRDSEQRPRYIIGIHEDITEAIRVVKTLQANQELLDLAQKAARAMAFDWYIQEKINKWSPEQEALYGLAPGTFDGTYESWKKLVHPIDWPLVVKALKHAQENGEISAEYRVVWPDGTIHWLAANGQMFFDDEGQPFRMVGFTADISSRKVVEEELRRSEAFLAQAQHVGSTGSFLWRATESNEITWSDELYRIYEFEPGTPLTIERIRAQIHPQDVNAFDQTVERARTTGDDFECQYRLLMPNNSLKYLRVVAHATRDENDQLEYVAAVQNVTERRLSEEALDKARSELAHVTRVMSLGALTASIAHEVNQPLAGIITNASTCLRMLDVEPPNVEGARETARRTIRDAHRASDVITRLRALFSKKADALELVDLNRVTREVITLSRSELERNRVMLRTELADDLALVTGDRVQLQQVILNLLRNGSDAMSDINGPRELLFKTEQEVGDCVRLSVQDVGIGLEPQSMDRLFQAFYTTKVGGMGMGLSVSRSIIENHGGRLWATPNDGPGVTFSFSIPCVVENIAEGVGLRAIAITDQKSEMRIS